MSDSDNKVLQVKEAIDRGAYESADVMDDASLDRLQSDLDRTRPANHVCTCKYCRGDETCDFYGNMEGV